MAEEMYFYDSIHNGKDECLNFSTETADTVRNVKVSLGTFALVVNLLAIILIVISKKFKDITFRLVIYLLITDVFQAVAICLAVIPVIVPDEAHPAQLRNGSIWPGFCTATGFLLMSTMWMGNIVIIWIVAHLLVLGWRLNRSRGVAESTNKSRLGQNCSKQVNWEKWGIVFLIVLPLVIGFIPFSMHPDMYGLSGLWCWIKIANLYCGDIPIGQPLTVALVFFYAPLVLIVLFSITSMSITIVLVCYGAVRRSGKAHVYQHQRRMKEIMLVLAYPMLYCTVCLLLLANRIYSLANTDNYPFDPLWITHAVADPVRVMLPAIAFLLHPYVWRDLCSKRTPSTSDNNATATQNPNQNSSINGESMEDKLLTTKDDETTNKYGSCDDSDDRYLSSVIEQRK